MEDILIGTTDRTVLVFIPDPTSTTGAGETGLAAADVTVTYTRVETDNDVVHTDVTSSLSDLSALTDAHADWGWKEVSATLSKGLYRLDLADALFAAGAWYAVVQVTITSGTAAATPKAFRLVARDDLDAVRLGLTALPNADADAAGGLPISDAGGLDLDAILADTNELQSDDYPTTLAAIQATADAIETDTQDVQGRLPASLVGGRIDASIGAIASGVIAAASFAANALDAVWSTTTRVLTAGTNIVLAKGVGVTGFNDLSAAAVNAEADQALSDYAPPTRTEATADKDEVLARLGTPVGADLATDLLNLFRLALRGDAAAASDLSTFVTALNADLGAGGGAFNNTTDAMQAIRDRGDAAWLTATGFSTHSAADVASAVQSSAASDPLPANVKEINDTTVTGDGSGTPWGPA